MTAETFILIIAWSYIIIGMLFICLIAYISERYRDFKTGKKLIEFTLFGIDGILLNEPIDLAVNILFWFVAVPIFWKNWLIIRHKSRPSVTNMDEFLKFYHKIN